MWESFVLASLHRTETARTGHRASPLTKINDAELWCFLWSAPEENVWVNTGEAGDLIRQRTNYDFFEVIQNTALYMRATATIGINNVLWLI